MNILILTNSDEGLYQFRKELIDALLARHKVSLAMPCEAYAQRFAEKGCALIHTPIDRRGIRPLKDLSLFFRYLKLIRSVQPDIILSYTIKPNIYGGLSSRLYRKAFFANITGLGSAFQGNSLLKRMVCFLYRAALKKAKAVFFENDANQNVFLQSGIIKSAQAVLLPGAGVNLSHFVPLPYPEHSDTTSFLFIGRIMQEKGMEELLEACKRLYDEGFQIRLELLGTYEEDYRTLVSVYEKQGWLHFAGYQDDILPYIQKTHCFVLPSWHEGMANTNLECAACARPLITSNIPGCKEAVIEGKSGLLCEAKNSDSLYAAMRAFLAMPPAERIAMGLAGRAHMEQVFDKQAVVEKTLAQMLDRSVK